MYRWREHYSDTRYGTKTNRKHGKNEPLLLIAFASIERSIESAYTCADPERRQGVRATPEKLQKYSVSEQYWSESPEKSKKLTRQHSMLGHHRHARETQFKRFADGPMMARF